MNDESLEVSIIKLEKYTKCKNENDLNNLTF